MLARPLDAAVVEAVEAVGRAIENPLAVVLGGSHARGSAVWRSVGGVRAGLSDIDLHVVVRDRPARRAAEHGVAAARPATTRLLRERGLVAPLEVGVHEVEAWCALPARPATLELRESGVVVAGDPAWLDRLPRWSAKDVSTEEVLLLVENRAFELMRAERAPAGDPLAVLLAAHAQYKAALDLATVERLLAGAWESSAGERVAAARAARRTRAEIGPEPEWDRALAWAAGATPEDSVRTADLLAITECWVRRWMSLAAPEGGDAFDRAALRAAARARPRRRLRLALAPEMPRGTAPPIAERLRFAAAGTPQHRLNASAGAFLAAGVFARRAPADAAAIDARLARVLTLLGVVVPGRREDVADALLATWRSWVVGETRGEEPA